MAGDWYPTYPWPWVPPNPYLPTYGPVYQPTIQPLATYTFPTYPMFQDSNQKDSMAPNNHPLIVRVATRIFLHDVAGKSDVPPEGKAGIHQLLGNGQAFAAISHEFLHHVQSVPEAMAALDAPVEAGGTHPFIDYLLANWQTFYAIAVIIAAMFGIVLPPLPPIPPKP